MEEPKIAVAGAGAIGCFVGGLLEAAGRRVAFLGRPGIVAEIAGHGLRLTDLAGLDVTAAPGELGSEPDMLAGAGIVLVCVKSSATAEMAQQIAGHAPKDAVVISLQNGVGNARLLRQFLPGHDVRAGVVEFNVVPTGAGRFHRSVTGEIVIEAGPGELGRKLSVPGLVVHESDRIAAVQWGKLLFNLNNAINALSGLTLREMLLDRRWRRVMAAQMQEALNVLAAAGTEAAAPTPVPASWLPAILRLPTPLFRLVARPMLTVDPHAKSSMAQDLAKGRKTEIDALQGEVIRLAAAHGVAAPINARIARLVHAAEEKATGSPPPSPEELLG